MRPTTALLALGLVLAAFSADAQQEPQPPAAPLQAPVPAEPEILQQDAEEDLVAVRRASGPPAPSQQPVVLDPTAPAKTEVTVDRRSQLGVGLGFSGPIGVAGSLRLLHGLGADIRDDDAKVKAVCAAPLPHCAQGFLLQVDGGSGGGKLSLGIGAVANVHDDDFKGNAGAALRVALARTWGNPIGTEPDLTYLGTELDLSIFRINLTTGLLFRVAGGDRGAGVLFSWGIGFGL